MIEMGHDGSWVIPLTIVTVPEIRPQCMDPGTRAEEPEMK